MEFLNKLLNCIIIIYIVTVSCQNLCYFVFSEGINFIYEYFNSENKIGDDLIDTTARLIGRNKILNKYFKNFADRGLQN